MPRINAAAQRMVETWHRVARQARTFHYRHDGQRVRVWLEEDENTDRFEVMSGESFAEMQLALRPFAFTFKEADD